MSEIKQFKPLIWESQLPVDYLDTTLVISTPETVVADLSGGKPCRLWYIMVEQTNNGATNEDIELLVTMPNPNTGVETVYTFARAAAVSGTIYYAYIGSDLATGDFAPAFGSGVQTVFASRDIRTGMPLICKYVGLIQVQQTTAVDAVAAQFEVNIIWDKLD